MNMRNFLETTDGTHSGPLGDLMTGHSTTHCNRLLPQFHIRVPQFLRKDTSVRVSQTNGGLPVFLLVEVIFT